MSEPDEAWSQMLEDALAAARQAGRHDVADYLDLRSRNDALRRAGLQWLLDRLISAASEAGRDLPAMTIDREEPHKFEHQGAKLAGTLLKMAHGVRCLTVEAGWTRTPEDGFMRGGGLAIGRLTHFGMARSNADLFLKPTAESPGWYAAYPDGKLVPVDESFLRRQVEIFLGLGPA